MYRIVDEQNNILFETDDINKFWKRYHYLCEIQVEDQLERSMKVLEEVLQEKYPRCKNIKSRYHCVGRIKCK